MSPGRIVVAHQIILPAYRDGCPVAEGVLFGLVDLIGHNLFFTLPMRVLKSARLPRRLRAIVDGWGENLKVRDPGFAHHVAGQGGVPGSLGGIDGLPVLRDHVELALEVADHADVRPSPGRVESEALVFAGKPIAQVVVDDEMRVTVVGPVVVEEGFPIGVFRRGHGRRRRRRAIVDPVDHVATVPGVVTTFPSPLMWRLL